MKIFTDTLQDFTKKIQKTDFKKLVVSKEFLAIILLFLFYAFLMVKGFAESYIHADLARDLHEMSNLWLHRIVWLGPQLSAGFPISPFYFYLLFPGLIVSFGNAHSLILSHLFFSLIAILFLVFSLRNSSIVKVFFTIVPILLSPAWILASTHPWNGHLYVIAVLVLCTSLWFKHSVFISSAAFGSAVALHPAGILLAPLVLYEWISNKNKVRNAIIWLIGLLVPWIPIFAFEFITNGLLTRQWLSDHPSTLSFVFNTQVWGVLIQLIKLPKLLIIFTWAVVFFFANTKEKHWWIILTFIIGSLFFVVGYHSYYLLGLWCALVFLTVQVLAKKLMGQIILFVIITTYCFQLFNTPVVVMERNIEQVSNIVDESISQLNLDSTKSYGVVNFRDSSNSTPQADDYRFFLRTKGLNVVNTTEHTTADELLLFIEVPEFDWENWNDSYHINLFGEKTLVNNIEVDGVKVVHYRR